MRRVQRLRRRHRRRFPLSPGRPTIDQLLPATTYHVRVLAANELGQSQPRVGLVVTMDEEAPEGPPVQLGASSVTSRGFTFSDSLSADHVAAAAGGRAKRNHPRLPRFLRIDGRQSSGKPADDDNDVINHFPVQFAEILQLFRPGILSVRPSVRLSGKIQNNFHQNQVLAFTEAGDGMRSSLTCATKEDIPEMPSKLGQTAGQFGRLLVAPAPYRTNFSLQRLQQRGRRPSAKVDGRRK